MTIAQSSDDDLIDRRGTKTCECLFEIFDVFVNIRDQSEFHAESGSLVVICSNITSVLSTYMQLS